MIADDSFVCELSDYYNLVDPELWDFTLKTLLDEDQNKTYQNLRNDHSFYNNSSECVPKKKSCRSQESIDRWNRIRRVNAFPRVLKRDIRRNYPLICINAINSGDLSIYENYFYQYFKPDCLWTITKGKFMEEFYRFIGHVEFLKLYRISLDTMPDFHASLINYQVQLDPNSNKSKIIFKLNYSGTLMKCLPKDYFFLEQNILQNDVAQQQIEYKQMNQDRVIEVDGKEYQLIDRFHTLSELNIVKELCTLQDHGFKFLSQPIKAGFDTIMTLFLDENYCITRLDALILDSTFKFEPIIL